MNAQAPSPDSAIKQDIARGLVLLQQGQLAEAAALAERLLATQPQDPSALIFASEVRVAEGKTEAALGLTEEAIAIAPGLAPLQLKKARLQSFLRRRRDARASAEALAAQIGDDPQALWAIGNFYNQCSEPATARRYFERVREALGDQPRLLYDLAACQFFTGDFPSAEATLDRLLALVPQAGSAHYLRAAVRMQTPERNHVAELQAQLRQGIPDPAERAACLYALAKELEDLGDDAAAFAALQEGAKLKRSTLRYDLKAELANIAGIAEAFTADVMANPDPGHPEAGAIFIVGMPRTGTTLVESILSRVPGVAAAGELMDFGICLADASRRLAEATPGMTQVQAATRIDFRALGADYLRGAREVSLGSGMFIDKLPVNYLYCGAIRKALPNARIIHLTRDPMDSCYAIFKTLFAQAYFFSYDLDELGQYYAAYHALMRHWHAVMPGAILDVSYEQLVADPEGEARRILEWCGLDWRPGITQPSDADAPAATASAAQVRQPIHARSVQKWRRFESQLAPLQAMLRQQGVIAD